MVGRELTARRTITRRVIASPFLGETLTYDTRSNRVCDSERRSATARRFASHGHLVHQQPRPIRYEIRAAHCAYQAQRSRSAETEKGSAMSDSFWDHVHNGRQAQQPLNEQPSLAYAKMRPCAICAKTPHATNTYPIVIKGQTYCGRCYANARRLVPNT
jgi:hypothetical protein